MTSDRSLVPELIAAQVARQPEAIALVRENLALSYGALDRRAEHLARHMRRLGVGPEVRVAVFLDRSADLVIALLACWKAGGAYLPLDPAYPPERLTFMLADADAMAVLTSSARVGTLPETAAHVVIVDHLLSSAPGSAAADEPDGGPDPEDLHPAPRHLSHLIYTSGSTGRPKGVAIEHRSTAAMAHWALETFATDRLQGVAAVTSICFDLSVYELFVPLAAGGRVVLFDHALALADLQGNPGLTLVNTVPSAMTELLRLGAIPNTVRTVNLAGEPLKPPLVREIVRRTAVREVYNLYGPSEDTTYSTAMRLPREVGTTCPIGRPIRGTRGYLVDERMQRVPEAQTGELLLAGAGLARGYANRPAQTAERFVPDPFTQRAGQRLYRTGDRVRQRDGALEFLNRTDHQVKIHGYRIEPGEIEAALLDHPAVADAVVVVRQDGVRQDCVVQQDFGDTGRTVDPSLVAWVQPTDAAESTGLAAELRTFLGSSLPDYMVPAAFATLDTWPLTPNGKVDRSALAHRTVATTPTGEPASRDRDEVPRTPLEEILAALWSEVLDVPGIGLHDRVYELGGHSLNATQVVSRVRNALQLELTIPQVLSSPTVADLARTIEDVRRRGDGQPAAPEITPRGEADEAPPASFAQSRLWFLDRWLPGNIAYNLPLEVRFQGALSPAALQAALEAIRRRHEALRTTFEDGEGGVRQVVRPATDGALSLPVIDLAALEDDKEQTAQRLLRATARQPFDLVAGPLWRCLLLRFDAQRHVLLANFHHIVFDGWSIGVFFTEIEQAYRTALDPTRRLDALASLPVQYPDFALWQHRWLGGAGLEHSLAYWRQRLADAPKVLELPTDRPRPATPTGRGDSHRFTVDSELRAAIEGLGRRHGTTLFMVLLAAYQVLLARLSGQRDLVIGTAVAGRGRQEIEHLIGFFVNTLALRGRLTGDPSFDHILAAARRETLTAYTHQDLPFEKLIEDFQPERDARTHPIFQVMLVVQSTPTEIIQSTPTEIIQSTPTEIVQSTALLRFESRLLPIGTSRFDFGLQFEPTATGLIGTIEYSTDLFDAITIERWSDHLLRVLRGAVEHPHAKLSELPLLAPSMRHQVLIEWQGQEISRPPSHLIERFATWVERTPDAVAVVDDGGVLTYGALDHRADRLARRLLAARLGPAPVVGVLLERSPATVVALLAILKAGGTFLALDPEDPEDRLRWLIDDAGVQALLTSESIRSTLCPVFAAPTRAPAPTVLRVESAVEPAGPSRPLPEIAPQQPAYLIYTSGSTGRPKAVVVPHSALAHVLTVRGRHVTPLDSKLHKTALSFDVALAEIFLPLFCGGRTVLARPGGQHDPAYLNLLIVRERITLAVFSPAQLASLLTEGGLSNAPTLRTVGVGGEAVPADLPGRFFARSTADLYNRYGPSEATIFMTEWHCRHGETLRSLPIGRPLPGVAALLLDDGLQPVPVGVPGELHVAGPTLATGYLGRPARTAAAFIPAPHGDAGDRLYRTGDLARTCGDGALEFLGRRDHQVKVRGFRIELGEVEAALIDHADVHEAAVTVRDDLATGPALVAWLVTGAGHTVATEALKRYLGDRLPHYMMPTFVVPLPELPRTLAGKVDRAALEKNPLTDRETAGTKTDQTPLPPQGQIEQAIAAIFAEILEVERPGLDVNFFDLGGHSLLMPRLQRHLQEAFGRQIPIVDLFRRPTIASLAALLGGHPSENSGADLDERSARQENLTATDRSREPIAIIGLAGRFPGAASPAELWVNLRAGIESITFFDDDELLAAGIDPDLVHHPDYVKARGVLDDIEHFDAAFFGYSPREAEFLDPQQRLFLECAWEALEDAGYPAGQTDGRIGVFGGVSGNTYEQHVLAARPEIADSGELYQLHLSGDKDFVTTRVSYKLDLTGPSLDVQSACSTSLAAVHLACASLRRGECEMALAGAACIQVPHHAGHLHEEGMIYSGDGHCRAFDARADGIVDGNGAGMVLLKPLSRAQADGDRIRAVIRGSAINNDGALKAGYTAPSVEGQARVIADALADADVDADSLSYVEAHGTGTALGDPIETAALERAFGSSRRSACALGSVKTNLGHLDTASGVTGLIKTTLALEQREIPPSLHFESPNPQIDFASGPFFVNRQLRPWHNNDTLGRVEPRRAGVSSFGMGGTNVHAVVEEAPIRATSDAGRPWQLLTLSARTPTALDQVAQRLAEHLRMADEPLADTAYTLAVGRKAFRQRRIVVCRDRDEAAQILAEPAPRALRGEAPAGERRGVVYLLPGQGVQKVGMGRDLYRGETTFRHHFDRCAEILRPSLDFDLRHAIEPPTDDAPEIARQLNETWLTQPLLFAFEYALARQWMAWGLTPEMLLGHSLGEITAACLAGVMELDDALGLVVERGRLLDALPEGAMLSVMLPEDEIRPRLNDELTLAAVNGPRLATVSGPPDEIDALEERLEADGIASRRLATVRAFHSPMVEPALVAYREAVAAIDLRPPRIPFLSGVTGTWIEPEEATDPGYWVRQMRHTVRFAEALDTIASEPGRIFLEVGPGRTLSSLARRHPAKAPAVASLGTNDSDQASLLTALGRLWTVGAAVDWRGVFADERRQRVSLPTYPFERRRCWVDPIADGRTALRHPARRHASTGGRAGGERVDGWFYAPCWRPAPPPIIDSSADAAATGWLVFLDGGNDDDGLGNRLIERLRPQVAWLATVRPAEGFEDLGNGAYGIDPTAPGDAIRLLGELSSQTEPLGRILHLWSVDPVTDRGEDPGRLEQAQAHGFYSLLALAKALAEHPPPGTMRLDVVSRGMQSLPPIGPSAPGKATLLGPCRVLAAEVPGLRCRSLDFADTPEGRIDDRLTDLLLDDLLHPPPAEIAEGYSALAYAGYQRWVEDFEPLALPPAAKPRRLRQGGVYLVTGGLGGIGLTLAHHLAEKWKARLVLMSRTALPPRDQWTEVATWEDGISGKIRQLLALEAAGAEVHVTPGDVGDPAAVATAIRSARDQFGGLHGVIHAAGIAGGELAAMRSAERAAAVLAAKLEGTLHLDRELTEPLDFVLLCSSLAAFLGGAGQIDYCAANAFLDLYAQHRSRRGPTPWIAVGWDGWRDVGMLAEAELPADLAADREANRAWQIAPEEGVEVFRRALESAQPCLIVSTRDLGQRVHHARTIALAEAESADSPAAAPRGSIEDTIAAIWRELLGVEEVRPDDSFFELGGHSLLATQILSRLRDTFGVRLTLRRILELTTLADQAAEIATLAGGETSTPLVPVRRDGELPLSFAQERLWFLERWGANPVAYNLPGRLRFDGDLDRLALARSLAEIERRHEALRTVFTGTDRPQQVITPWRPQPLPLVDLSGLDGAAGDGAAGDAAQRCLTREARRPFDLARGPLGRRFLLRFHDTHHELFQCFHHAAFDGWSMEIFLRELRAGYNAYLAGRTPSLPDLPVQYADFAVWQRQWLSGDNLAREVTWWRHQLDGAPRSLELPSDRPRPEVRSEAGADMPFHLPGSALAGLRRLAREEGATLFMVALAAFGTLLARLAGRREVVIGIPVASRYRTEIENLIGFFVNTLVLRVDLTKVRNTTAEQITNPRFIDLLARVRERALAAFEHEDLPFEKLVEELQPERHLSQTPLFQAVLVVQKAIVPQAMCEGLRFDPQSLAKGTSQFDLTLLLEEGDLELNGRFEYSTDLFEPATLHRWASHLRQLMTAVAEEPQRDVFDLPLLDPAQRHQVLRQWNDTTRRFPLADQPAHCLVAHQASNRPDAIAVEWADEHLSYGELQRRARRRADGLTAQGLGAEAMVGLCATRSPRLVEALLAIFEAGGVYVPIDPGHPPERQRHVLESCGAAWLMTDRATSTETALSGIARVDLHHSPPLAARSEEPRRAHRTRAQQLAYVLYTSGSTGEPKGAMLTHGSLSNLLLWTVDALGLGPHDRFLKRAPVSFDASVWELLMPLVCGGRLVLAGPGSERDPAQLVRELGDRRIDNALLVPTLANLALQQPGLRDGEGLRRLFSGGEALTRDLAERLDSSTLTRGEIVNLYGPTEACVVMTMARFTPSTPGHAAPPIDGATVPIGHAIANTQAYGLDPELRPQPAGVPGELFIGGVCLARGYLNDPRQTAESFLPDPFGTAGGRIYRSGDRVRSRSDGSWTFLRRRDDQIKLRGLRIEPGEIEVALNAHPAIRRAVLTVQAVEGAADQRLVAWLVAESTGGGTAAPLASADLRRFLAPTLPDYMVPSVYQWLDTLPATPTGKVDRKALRQRAIADADESRTPASKPSTPTAEILLGLCAEILGRERVGIDDSFFDLGGHSLLAIQLVARIREVFAIEIAVREIFEISDLATLARRLEGTTLRGSDAQGPPLEAIPSDANDPAANRPLSHAQEQLWFLGQWQPGGWEYNVNQIFRLSGPLDRTALGQALEAIERRHEILRTTFRIVGEEPRQRIAPWRPRGCLAEVDLRHFAPGPADVLTWLDARARQPFDLRQGPLWRALLVDTGDGERFLFLSFHHIVFDGWSQGVFLNELAHIYQALTGRRVPSLPKLAVQYADFAEWHRRWLGAEVLEREVAWWREHLAEAPERVELPTDRPRPTEWRGAGGVLPVRLPLPTADRLADTARQSRVTLFMVLLAAFDALIARLSGQGQVVVGSPVAGRTRRETEDLIGFFVNLLPLRLDLNGDPTFVELLTRVRSVALGAYAHQQVPFEKLVEELRPERRRDRNPLFQISFALQASSHQPTNLGELELQPLDLSTDRAKFDLTLGLEETPEGLEGLVEYCADLFDRTTAERLARGFERLVQGAVAAPGRRLSELPVLAQAERHQLQTEWNDTGRSPADRPTLPERFAAQAERMPEAVAVVYRDEAVSFGQLAHQAHRLAHHLRQRLAGRSLADRTIALCLERSGEMVAAILAVLEAGGAFLPLDPDLPSERLALLIDDADAELVISRQDLGLDLPSDRLHVWLDADRAAIDGCPAEVPVPRPAATDLAYLIYTSGTTGRPKAVQVEHGQLSHTLWASQSRFGWHSGDVQPVVATYSFDIFLFELFAPLLAGGTALLQPLRPTLDLDTLVKALTRSTSIHAVPTLMRALIETAGATATFPNIRRVFVGGEAVPPDLLVDLRRGFPAAIVRVLYGPTEGTIICSGYEVPSDIRKRLPLGRPLPGVTLRVCDPQGRTVPIGVVGELWIGGPGVSRGYLDRAELTAEKFPIIEGQRFYRTGDRARYDRHGELEFLGRVDFQVKIRGFRIELGEIEVALTAHPHLREAVVLAWQPEPWQPDEGGERQLVAFVVPAADDSTANHPAVDEATLASFLSESLPGYMVPPTILCLPALPVRTTGKVDRRALERTASEHWRTASAHAANEIVAGARTPMEELLVQMWRDLLDQPRVGIRDNFFQLGGHSLLATRLVSRLRATLDIELPLRDLFEAPTLAALARRLEEARASATEDNVPQESPSQPLGLPPLEPINAQQSSSLSTVAARARASFAQERLWFLDQWQPGSSAYNIPLVLHLSGPLDPNALERALNEIERRHVPLRTVFDGDGVGEHGEDEIPAAGGVLQNILPWRPRRLPSVDLTALDRDPSHERARTEAQRLLQADARRPFDLARGPIWRHLLFRLGPRDHQLSLCLHHIGFDGWSTAILCRELDLLYRAYSGGQPSPLPERQVHYPDFAAWQRQVLGGQRLEGEIDFWRRRLAGAPDFLELPTDRPRPSQLDEAGGTLTFELPQPLLEALESLSQRHRVTLFMTLVAAFSTLLARLSRQRDVLLGTPIANRLDEATESMIGFFVNTLVLRVELDEGLPFSELLAQVRTLAFDVFAHQLVPFEKLVEALQPERHLDHTPFFQVSLALHHAGEPPALGDLEVDITGVETGLAKFDLTLLFEQTTAGLFGLAEYRTALFDPTTIQRWLRQLRHLLSAAVRDPEYDLFDLPLLDRAERGQLLRQWNDTARSLPHADVPVHRLFAQHAAPRPESIAVESGDQYLSFDELRRQVRLLAGELLANGLEPQARVGLCLERQPPLIIAILAVLEAGGLYVPLDPTHPEERRASLLANSSAAWLLSEPLHQHRPTLTALHPRQSSAVTRPTKDSRTETAGEPLAYVLHTSGSTGQPKGVMVPHRALSNLLAWSADSLGINHRDRTLHRAAIGFDASVWEIFVPLATGGRLVLGSPGCERDPAVLARDLAERRIDNLVMVPTMANLLLQEPGLEGATGLKRLLCGGEIVSAELVASFAASPLRNIDLFNIYGPTEACVLITAGRCHLDLATAPAVSEVVVDGGSLAIGRSIANTRTYSLDQRLDPVAIGAPGELFIGGVCLAAGYLDAPRQTAVTYLPDPFTRRPGERLYRTGDLVRSLADGRWLFLRRCDRQIKLRGVRIEPGEIEAALRAHPAIRGAVVTVQTPQAAAGDLSAGSRQDPAARLLVAWLEGTGQDHPDNESLRGFLEKSLPATLVPSSFQWLEALPLTTSGKVDRGALARRPLILDGPREDTSRLPRSATEEILLGVWTDVLQSPMGLKDNFFDLGGHSLLATQVASRAANLFDLPIGPRWLFEQPTVAEMATEIDRVRHGGRAAAAEPIRPIARDQTLPLSFAQERMWFLDQFSAGGNSYASLAPLRFRGPLNASALRRAFDQLVARHEVLRTTFTSSGSEAHQVISACCDHPLPLIDLTRLDTESVQRRELSRHIGTAYRQPYDLMRGPLFRTQLLRLAEDDHVVLLGNHHAVFDGWSMDILVRELGELYNAAVGGRPAALPPLPIQYADFAAWQRQRLHGEALEEQLSFWRRTLGETTEAGLLPVDRPRDANGTSRAAHRTFTVSAATSQALRELSRQRGTTLFMTLLAALQALLQRHTGADKVVVGTPIANRHHEAIEGLIGFFVNTLAIPADFRDRPSFATLLEQAREAALGAYAHQDLPFEKLVEELRPERRNSTQSLFQVLFTFQNVPQEPVDLDDLQLEPLTADDAPNEGGGSHPAIFELSLVMAETDETLAGDFEYDAALFESATMEGFVSRFERLLDAVAADPEQPLADISLFAEDEEQRWLRAAAERLAHEAAPTRPAENAGDPLADEKRSESKLRAKVSGRRDDLSDAKRALLARRLRGRKKKPSPESIPQGVGD